MSRRLVALITLAVLVASLVIPTAATAAPAAAADASIKAPRSADSTALFGLTLSLPPEVAAIDGRVLVKHGAAEVVGLAPAGAGTGFRPEDVTDGYAIGAFGLEPVDGRTSVDIAVAALATGRLQLRVVIDSAADKSGARIEIKNANLLATVTVDGGKAMLKAPDLKKHEKPNKAPGKIREILVDGKIDQRDVDAGRGEWIAARTSGAVCGLASVGDVNADGCTDVVDVQSLIAAKGKKTAATRGGIVLASATQSSTGAASALAAPLRTFTVTSTADTADVAPGNGVCANSVGQCTLRAAMTEADYLAGEDLINFNLAGTAPVRIQLASALPIITSPTGGVIIDGYSQPGSAPNTASFGSNAIPGVEIRGLGSAARQHAMFITSPNNTVRGLLFGNTWRGIFLDGVNARDNRIVGNWLGFTNTQTSSSGQYGIILNVGANRNLIGTPALADRNVIGNWSVGIDLYGTGVDLNVIQNNVFCIRPNGLTANCSSAIDHNFGPKNGMIGGFGTNERNYFGPSSLQCVEYSHGYNPSGPPGTDFSLAYQINGNSMLGNWVGFRHDGSYSSTYRCGLNNSSADNAQAINVYDGANDNIVDGNYVGSVYDGIQTMAPTAQRNIIRNNIIGESPLGQAAPLTRWGVVVRWASKFSTVENNRISNAAAGGIGLLNVNQAGQPQSPAYNIKLTRNIVTDTNGPAIDLFGIAGPDPNDPGDADMGANTLINSPVITSATATSVRGTAASGATVEVYRTSRPAGQYGLPAEYLGSVVVPGNGNWVVPVGVGIGQTVSAIQILTDASTSEFAANVSVTAAPPQAPTITSAATTTFVVGTAGSFTVTTSGSPTAALAVSGSRPSGVTFVDNGNGTATLSGTPAAGSAGAYPLTITASNGVLPNASQAFTLQVNAAPSITSADETTFVAGSAGTFTVTTTGRPNATLSVSGDLPSGVTFTNNGNGSGTLGGTPINGSEGTYALTFTATNGVAPNATQSFTLTVDPAPVGAPFAADSFTRTVANGWGSAETGGPWTITAAPWNFSVDGSTGQIALAAGATRSARLGNISAVDADMLVDVEIDKLPTGGNVWAYIVGRRVGTDTEYRGKVRIAANGSVFLQPERVVSNAGTALGPEVQVPGLVVVPGSAVSVRVQYLGTSPTLIRMRAWTSGSAEPATWNVSQTDSQAVLQAAGAIGLRAYLAGGVTVAPVVISFDDLVVTP